MKAYSSDFVRKVKRNNRIEYKKRPRTFAGYTIFEWVQVVALFALILGAMFL